MHAQLRIFTLAASVQLLFGCSLAPTYHVPQAASPAAFKEASPMTEAQGGSWKEAQPSESLARGQWWQVFGDQNLSDYEVQALEANQDLKSAVARLKEARALRQTASSARYPTLDAGFGLSRQQNAPDSLGVVPGSGSPDPQNVWRMQGSVSYEVDLFGRVTSGVNAATAEVQQSEALLRSVQLAVQSDVAQTYFLIRSFDSEMAVYDRTVDLRREALNFVQHRFEAGYVSDLDLSQAKAELATAQSEAMTVLRQRAMAEHAFAVLLGKAPSDLTVPPAPLSAVTVSIPAGLPSDLLERRPDITAAERKMAAENARIGIAKAAFFPSLSLTGEGGFESSSLGDLFLRSSRAFLLGPLVGTSLNLPIFDGGRRKGNLANARAKYEEDVADYRQQVLIAFREVEDNLVDIRILADQTKVQNEAVAASDRAATVSRSQYENGSVSYLNVIETERALLQARLAAVRLEGARAKSTVKLIRALGGGWDINSGPNSAQGGATAISGPMTWMAKTEAYSPLTR